MANGVASGQKQIKRKKKERKKKIAQHKYMRNSLFPVLKQQFQLSEVFLARPTKMTFVFAG